MAKAELGAGLKGHACSLPLPALLVPLPALQAPSLVNLGNTCGLIAHRPHRPEHKYLHNRGLAQGAPAVFPELETNAH